MDVRRVIGNNVRKHRLAADLSQEAVAVRMGVDRAYISALELGQRNPTAVTLWHTAQALGVKVVELLEEPDDMPATAPPARKRASKKPAL
jgi:transcriptional regulator with XRE-family HTH domain